MSDVASEFVKLEVEGGIARITLCRSSKRNALTREFLHQIARAVDQTAADSSVRLLVLSAEGPVFCAGMDLGEMQQRATQPDASEQWKADTQVYRDLLASLLTLSVPTLAVVQGAALAGGLGLVLACDMVLAAENASFSLPEPVRGISAAVVAPLLIYRIGSGMATYLLLSGRRISATEGHHMGLCHEIVAADQLAERERELSASILSGAPSALVMTKQHIIDCAGEKLLKQLDRGMQISAEARETSDAREGLAAFLEKRKPSWNQ